MAMVGRSSCVNYCSSLRGIFNRGCERGDEFLKTSVFADDHQVVTCAQAHGGFGIFRDIAARDGIPPFDGEDMDAVAGTGRQLRQRASAEMYGNARTHHAAARR